MSTTHYPTRRAFGHRSCTAPEPGHVTIRRGTAMGAGVAFVLVAIWGAGASWFLFNGDTLAAGLLAKQRAMQDAYEEKLAALRGRLDQAMSQKLLIQETFQTRLNEIGSRQARLEASQATLARSLEQSGAAVALAASPASDAFPTGETLGNVTASATREPKPAPVADPLGLRLGGGPAALLPSVPTAPGRQSSLIVEEQLGRLDGSVRAAETSQLRLAEAIRRRSSLEIARWRRVVAELGLNPDLLEAPAPKAGIGGPYVPVSLETAPGSLDAATALAQKSFIELDQLRRATAALPLASPTAGKADLSSGFGMRIDPFTRGPAMHTGLDFRADFGTYARATAAEKVVAAEYAGGYGKMVEIEHGNGLSTRYAHLSSIRVVPGQTVSAGTVVGKIGSSGRSTGAHLHYEIRIDGTPVDPQRFLRAGARLKDDAVLTASGGPD